MSTNNNTLSVSPFHSDKVARSAGERFRFSGATLDLASHAISAIRQKRRAHITPFEVVGVEPASQLTPFLQYQVSASFPLPSGRGGK